MSAVSDLPAGLLVVALPLTHAAMYGPLASFFSELDVRVRYSGASIGYLVAGGLSPDIATSWLKAYGSSSPIALSLWGCPNYGAIGIH